MKEIVIRNDLREARGPEEMILREVDACGYCESAVFAVKLAMEEAIANAFRHGNQRDPCKCIHVRYQVSTEKIEIEIRDEGEGFQPEQVPDPTHPDYIHRPHGRGIMLMRAYLDEVEFTDNGRTVRMVKRK